MRNAANMPVAIRLSRTSISVCGLTSAIGYRTFLRMNPPQISKAAAARKSSLRSLGGYDRPDVGAFIDTDRS